MPNSWRKAQDYLNELARDSKSLSYGSFGDNYHTVRKLVASPIHGIQFETETSWMLNGTFLLILEAERSYFFGIFSRSIYITLEFPPDGTNVVHPADTRIELSRTRFKRRNWSQDAA